MTNPVKFIDNIARMSKTVFLWTHYYDASLRSRANLAQQFEEPNAIEISGEPYTMAKRNYGEALNWAGFCGGSKPWSFWLTRNSLYRALSRNGLEVKWENFDHPDHPNGPALALVAVRT